MKKYFKKILLSGLTFSVSISTLNAKSDFETLISLSSSISLMVHELQKERGLTAGFLSSKGSVKFTKSLKDQRELTDNRVLTFKKEELEIRKIQNSKLILKNIKRVDKKLGNLENIRSLVDVLKIPTSEAIRYYSDLNEDSLKIISKLSKYAKNEKRLQNMISSYYFFLVMKEKLGILRAVGTGVIAKDSFDEDSYLKWISLISSIKVYEEAFLNSAPPTFKKEYEKMKYHPIFNKIDKKMNIIKSKGIGGGFGLDAKEWFDDMTIKINQYKKLDDKFLNAILEESEGKDIDISKIKIEENDIQEISDGAEYTFIDINGDKQTVQEREGTKDKTVLLKIKNLYNKFPNGKLLKLENIFTKINDGQVKVIKVNRDDIFKIDLSEVRYLGTKIVLGYIDNVVYIGLNRLHPIKIDLHDERKFKRNKRVKVRENLKDLKFDKSRVKVKINYNE